MLVNLAEAQHFWHTIDMNRANALPADRQADGSSDRRWVILCEDGRSATLSRAGDPSEDDILRAEEALKSQGLRGWLAIQSHSQYTKVFPTFIEVRRLASPCGSFAEAVAALRSLSKS